MTGNEIKDTLERILEARSQKAESQRSKAQSLLQTWEEERETLNQIYSKFSSLQPDERGKVCGEDAAALLDSIQKQVGLCDDAVQKAAGALENLAVRFSRPTVNLVIVGAIGAGKSKLLQSASGLSDDCIPSYAGSSCTGVTSIIENSNVETEAVFTFKTRQEALEDMRREITRFAFRLHAKGEISQEMPDFVDGVANLRRLQKIADQTDQPIIGANDGVERTVQASDKRELDSLLELYDSCRPDWEPYLDGGTVPDSDLEAQVENGVRQYVLRKPSKIERYVSKHDASDKRPYYQYAAVKKAVIRTRFPDQIDARIRLVDTVGIGDTAADTEARIAEAVRDDADGVIFLLSVGTNRPSFLTQQDRALIEKFQDIYDTYCHREINEDGVSRKEKRTKYWMAFLVNDRPIAGAPPDNGRCYLNQAILPSFSGKGKIFGQEGVAYRDVLDVADPAQAAQMLSTFLRQIAEHLAEIDAGIETAANHDYTQAEAQLLALRKKYKDIRVYRSNSSRQVYIANIAADRIDHLKKQLGEYAGRILAERDRGNQNASFLQQCLEQVRRLKEGETLTDISAVGNPEGVSLKGIIDYYHACYNGSSIKENFPSVRLAVFDALQGVIRTIGSRSLPQQKTAEEDFKREIAVCFIDCLQLDCQKLGDNPAKALEANDPRFFQKASQRLIEGLPRTEEIRKAFESLDTFRLDDANGIAKALFCCLAAEHLRDTPYDVQEFPPDGDTDAERLLRELEQKLQSFLDAVSQRTMSEIYLIDETDQKYHELVNFIQILNPIYEGKWQTVFAGMDENGFLRSDTQEQSRLLTLAAIAEDLDILLQTL